MGVKDSAKGVALGGCPSVARGGKTFKGERQIVVWIATMVLRKVCPLLVCPVVILDSGDVDKEVSSHLAHAPYELVGMLLWSKGRGSS